MDDDLIENNPLNGWVYRKKEGERPEDDVDPLSPEEQSAVLERLRPHLANLIQFCFWSELRISEVIALDW